MEAILSFFRDILKEPAFLMGLIACVGLLALKTPWHKVLTGTMGPILGYLMLAAGAGVIVSNLDPLSQLIEHGFNITGVVPNNEAVTSVAQKILGVETMSILVVGLLLNLAFARFTRFKYIFLTGHHSFFMACLLSAVLGAVGFKGAVLILLGGFLLGAWSAISPAIGQKYTLKVTDGDEIAMGHFGSLGYYLSAWVGSKVGKGSQDTEDLEISEKWSFLRNTTISTGLIMVIFYLIATVASVLRDPAVANKLATGQNPFIFAIKSGLTFAVGVAIVYAGVRMILADLIPAFQGIADKLIPNAIPAVDCAVFFPYAPTAVILGFASSFIGGLIGMLILGAAGGVLIIPGMVPHFFCGATAGIYGNSTGGRRGAIVGAFVNGLFLAFLPAMLLPVLGKLGFSNTTFGDFDFGVLGILLGRLGTSIGQVGIYIVLAVMALVLIIPSFMSKSNQAINNITEEN
ncbi:PTS ascorbate transporter subunit IIC [Streptococcus porcinus]|uniref:Ascorbate-specific PTS system EIIC component n=2 Tax=Streptococcus porcinus TaxID=1340 RepID=A0A4V6LYA5_STRPO|nr:PTS ascorbate transporter subunit IIC [Streptococcus porcinus]EGJ27673.1 putative sugar-specific permease, SgaT/UlaA [Streptococcus porcinus str. Jelinkova 176]MBA2796168.1 PTS ascorbate transporter subunit IIC [Streptococcus porcinus]SQG42818.1 PTS system ascorbate-specific transporter subunit IIC [Streptococcus porcinus]VTT41829.1 PTS system ascorbate-specific transporter subunit IIC [Streptococcus porcinus]VTT43070.1 PTS system ascorbate-specific transporter subunit IIC [Streptococcus po